MENNAKKRMETFLKYHDVTIENMEQIPDFVFDYLEPCLEASYVDIDTITSFLNLPTKLIGIKMNSKIENIYQLICHSLSLDFFFEIFPVLLENEFFYLYSLSKETMDDKLYPGKYPLPFYYVENVLAWLFLKQNGIWSTSSDASIYFSRIKEENEDLVKERIRYLSFFQKHQDLVEINSSLADLINSLSKEQLKELNDFFESKDGTLYLTRLNPLHIRHLENKRRFHERPGKKELWFPYDFGLDVFDSRNHPELYSDKPIDMSDDLQNLIQNSDQLYSYARSVIYRGLVTIFGLESEFGFPRYESFGNLSSKIHNKNLFPYYITEQKFSILLDFLTNEFMNVVAVHHKSIPYVDDRFDFKDFFLFLNEVLKKEDLSEIEKIYHDLGKICTEIIISACSEESSRVKVVNNLTRSTRNKMKHSPRSCSNFYDFITELSYMRFLDLQNEILWDLGNGVDRLEVFYAYWEEHNFENEAFCLKKNAPCWKKKVYQKFLKRK